MTNAATAPVPPHNTDAERAVLGCILRNREAVTFLQQILPDAIAFYHPRHRTIYRVMQSMGRAQQVIDLVTFSNELARRKSTTKGRTALDDVGGRAGLVELIENVSATDNVENYAQIVAEKARLRRIAELAGEIQKSAYDESTSSRDLASMATQALVSLSQSRKSAGFVKLGEMVPELLEKLDRIQRGELVMGLRTGFKDLDQMTGGFQNGDLVIIAGRPSTGKTAFLNCIATNMAAESRRVGVFSAESPGEEYALRCLCTEARLDSTKLRRGEITADQWQTLTSVGGKTSGWEYYVESTSGIEINQLLTLASQLKAEKDVEILFVDYLQLLSTTVKLNRREEVAYLSRQLKLLASRLNLPVIVASQLNRQLEQRQNKRPILADLKEAGEIEQDADVVIGMHRPELYAKKKEKETGRFKNQAEAIILKQRNGPIGTVHLYFNEVFTRFETVGRNEEMPF